MGTRTHDARVVKQEARGRWFDILDALIPGIDMAISKAGRHVPCPFHGGVDGFRFYKDAKDTGGAVCNTCGNFDDGLSLLKFYYGGDFPKAVQEVGEFLCMEPGSESSRARPNHSVPQVPVESEHDKRKREYKDRKSRDELKKLWSQSFSLSEPEAEPVRLYLARRGLKLIHALQSDVLRYHPKVSHFDEGQFQGDFPAMLAMVFDKFGQPVTIHRTWLTEEGFKAPVRKVKKLMSYPSDRKLSGGCIPLFNSRSIRGNLNGRTAIGVTEGIETALAVTEASEGKLPVWALIGDRILENFVPPDWVDVVYVYGDQDVIKEGRNAGRDAAKTLITRLRKSNVEAHGWLPSKESIEEGKSGVDWLDIFLTEGPSAVPIPQCLNEPVQEVNYA